MFITYRDVQRSRLMVRRRRWVSTESEECLGDASMASLGRGMQPGPPRLRVTPSCKGSVPHRTHRLLHLSLVAGRADCEHVDR